MRAVNVEALSPCSAAETQYVSTARTCCGSASPRQRIRNWAAAFSPLTTSLWGTGAASPRADCATSESAAAERRPRSTRASSASMSTNCRRPHFAPSVASPAWRSAIARPARLPELEVLGRRHPRLEAVVHQQAPDLLEGVVPDELLDVDAAVAERGAFPVRLRDLGLEGDDALEAGSKLVHTHGRY